ncbi:hypothetical protein [Paenibacillus sanfengchensis]|uniref:hypothetical protein n=1 Tax=Paenibacillus sanfengchensis TaxID=3119819 RepID=UPI002FE273C1
MILVKKLSKQSGFTIENEYQIFGDQVQQYGSDRTTYPKFDDEPATWTPPKEEKKKFSWGKLFGNVMAGLAVVALVTVAAAFTVATLGAGAVVVGAAMAGTAAVATMAISDIAKGEVSDTGDYMWAAFKDSSIGAVTGAVFGPFGGAAGFVGKTAFNAAESAAESVMSQLMEGSFSFKTLLIDTGVGTLTAGALDSKIAKNLGGALGQGTNKALSKVMGNNLDKASQWVQGGLDAVGSKLGKAMDQVVDAGRRTGAKTGLDQVAPWIANGVEAARRKASQSLEQLAETGSTLAQSMFSRNRAVPAGGPDIEVEVPTRRNNEPNPPDRKDPPPPKRHPEPDKKPDQHHEPEPKKDNDQGNGNKDGGEGTGNALTHEEAVQLAREIREAERAELIAGKYIDPNTNEIYVPRVITVVVDVKTGKYYLGYNGIGKDLVTGNPRFNPTQFELHDNIIPLIEKTKQRAMDSTGKNSFQTWEVENCAEIQAVNQAFRDGVNIENMLLSTISTKNGKYKEMCKNCKVTFEDFVVDVPLK